MALQKDLLGLQYSQGINLEGMQEQVANLILEGAHDVETSISGTVQDGDEPVEGATVKIFDKNGNPYMHTITDVNGKYLFENLPVGTYSAAVACEGYRLSNAQSASLSEGDTVILDFSLTKDNTLLLGAVSGVVATTSIDGSKKPLGGVKISLIDNNNKVVAVTYTVDDGEFAFYDLNDGQYGILAMAQGYMLSNPISIVIVNGSIVNTNISLIEDSITNNGTINGTITNKQGQVVAGCFVGLYQIVQNGDGTTDEFLIARTKTNVQGQYLFGNVVAGNYVVKAKMNA